MPDTKKTSGDPNTGADAKERERARADAAATLRAHAWPPALLAALARLREGGFQAWLVGGTVRDVMLGREAEPVFDVATDLTPDQVSARFERVEPIGLRHGTVLVLSDGLRIECTTFRREGAYADARHPDRVEFTRDPEEDLARRDLTVNALAFDPASGVLLDPHGGALDLERRVLRAVGDPRARFAEDALRPLRVARLSAVLEMGPEPATRAALGSALDRSRLVAVERVHDELEKLMRAPRPSVGVELLREAGLLELWMPELARTWAVPQNRYHAYDVYLHSLYTCDEAPADKPRVRWAALLHDIGKPDTRVVRGGDGTFYNHQFVGAELADRLLERMRFPADERAAIVHLVREHMFDYRGGWSDAGLRRWLRRVGEEAVADLFDLRIADMLGNGLKQGFPVYLEEMRRRIERILAESRALKVTDLAVGGHDVMRVLGIPPGPPVRETLEALLEEVLDDPARNTRERLLMRLEERRGAGEAPTANA
ncbi:MAG: CCA tRNA nucleotidyltransferase [Candidatus Eisenbacteria bacterium]|uniref:CCA tRNA nucleotidyltransferase n=1 Tax=Eiseniibacteriota bacterium TaxID=2212470 RepID=A0A538SM45_UNCEI|nr:MAG: CCA tRNA nucleotidyltransferase [Candidatus Eisenbacteria bacterium]